METTEKSWSSTPQTVSSLPAQASPSAKTPFWFAGLWLLFIAPDVFAVADIQTILENMRRVLIPVTAMVLMISYAGGVYFIFSGLTMMKRLGNISTSHQAQPGELSGPLLKIFIGAALIYLPSTSDALTNSLFETGSSLFGQGQINYAGLGQGASLLGYTGGDSFSQQWASIANTLVMYIQFLGLLSLIKGWFIMAAAAAPGTQGGVVAKGLTHIIGGIIAMNFVGAVNVIWNTIFST